MTIDTWPEFLLAYGVWAVFCCLLFWPIWLASRIENGGED